MIRLSYLEWRAAGDGFGKLGAGRFRRRTPGKKGGLLRTGMVARTSTCLRRLAGGRRSGIVGFSRFLANPRVTVEALLDGWGAEHTPRCAGRHILAIQDSSEFNFTTTRERSRGLGEIGKGSGRNASRRAMAGPGRTPGSLSRFMKSRPSTHSCPNSKARPRSRRTLIRRKRLAGAAWIIAKLGGWDGYPKSRPPGPITFRHGLQYFKSLAHGWRLGNV